MRRAHRWLVGCVAVAGSAFGAPAAWGATVVWHMDETSGTVMKDAKGGHVGTLHNVLLGQPGLAGTAFGFPGSSFVDIPAAPDLKPGTAPVTVTISLNTTRVPLKPDWDLVRKGVAGTPGGWFKVEYQPSAQAPCAVKGSLGTVELTAGPKLNDGQWHTVRCIKTASAVRLVVDGSPFVRNVTIGAITNTAKVFIGSHGGTSEFFRGSLDEASIAIG